MCVTVKRKSDARRIVTVAISRIHHREQRRVSWPDVRPWQRRERKERMVIGPHAERLRLRLGQLCHPAKLILIIHEGRVARLERRHGHLGAIKHDDLRVLANRNSVGIVVIGQGIIGGIIASSN